MDLEISGASLQDPQTSLLTTFSVPSMFMIRGITTGFLTSVVTGMTCAYVSAIMHGNTRLPFIVSAYAGYIVGIVGFHRDTVWKSLLYLDRYPRLLQLHLDG